jgi:histidyl-tRNA synthetase
LLALDALKLLEANGERPTVFIANVGGAADSFAQNLVYRLRQGGVSAERDYLKRSLKAQMKLADKLGARFSLVIGDEEIASDEGRLKDMTTGEAENVQLSALEKFLPKGMNE